jgi:hypothetical protein
MGLRARQSRFDNANSERGPVGRKACGLCAVIAAIIGEDDDPKSAALQGTSKLVGLPRKRL